MINKKKCRKFHGVVEYCFSGTRFKVRIDSESCYIALNILGAKSMAKDKNQPEIEELFNEAQYLAKESLHQKDVSIDIFFTDKRGSFFGTLTYGQSRDFAYTLIESGFGMISVVGGKRPSNFDDLEQAQAEAKKAEIGIWQPKLKLMSTGGSKLN